MKYLLLIMLILLFSCQEKKSDAPESGKKNDSTQVEEKKEGEANKETDAKSGASKKEYK